jgi:hypothetical protein
MLIRAAAPDDAAAACEVLRASVSDLGVADDGNDPGILGRRLSDETPEKVAAWTWDASHSLLTAIREEWPCCGWISLGFRKHHDEIRDAERKVSRHQHVLLAAKRERPNAVASAALRHLEIEIRPHRHMV